MKQIMLDLIYPASNDILLFVSRGGENDWKAVRHSALTLAESGPLLMANGSQDAWTKDARLLTDAAMAAYKAAEAKDLNALAVAARSIDESCTACHKQYRPNVFPRDPSSKDRGSK